MHDNTFDAKYCNRLVLNLSNKCNLKCHYCYANGGSYGNLLHEVAHSVTSIRFDLEIEKISLILYYGFIPMFYVKQKNLYSLPNKKILKILTSGVMFNFFLVVCFWILYILQPNIYFLVIIWTNIKLIYSNLIPLSLTDGYFMLCILLKKPNIRLNMYRIFANPKLFFRIDKGHRFFILIKLISTFILLNFELTLFFKIFNIIDYSYILLIIINIVGLLLMHLVSKKAIYKINI